MNVIGILVTGSPRKPTTLWLDSVIVLLIVKCKCATGVVPEPELRGWMALAALISCVATGMALLPPVLLADVYGLLLEMDAPGWNPLAAGTNAEIYANVFLGFLILHAGLLTYYRMRFRPGPADRAVAVGRREVKSPW